MKDCAKITAVFFIFVALALPALAQQEPVLKLPAPDTETGMPLMQALKERKTSREFGTKELPLQVLSDLLWAAYGVNRPDKGGRTAPSARNVQEIDVYVATADGLYRYNARGHSLELTLAKDIRAATGKQDFVAGAPVNLVYVADLKRSAALGGQKEFYAALDTGFIAQNVYLFCASRGLATVVRALFDETDLHDAMNLKAGQEVILTQTVGYPK